MIKMTLTGVKQTLMELRSIGDRVHENARKTMHTSADRIVTLAQKMAPVDEGNLEEAIKKQIAYGPRGRLQIDIVIQDHINGVDVGYYATRMHEGVYRLGPKSQAKNDSQEETVGPGFLTRAAESEQDKLRDRVMSAVTKEIQR